MCLLNTTYISYTGEQNADAMDAFSRQLAATISGDINFNFNPQDNPNPSSGSQPSSLVDAIYVNDAFGTAHRAHGSIVVSIYICIYTYTHPVIVSIEIQIGCPHPFVVSTDAITSSFHIPYYHSFPFLFYFPP